HCIRYHSYQQRFEQILKTIGVKNKVIQDDKVSIIICTNRPNNIDIMLDNYHRQSHVNKELLLILNNDSFDINVVKNKINGMPNV
ncbi:hypothetical protein ACQP3F_32630, partial [Escherichia coli]